MMLDSKCSQSKPRSLEEGPIKPIPENLQINGVQSSFKYRRCIGIVKFILYLEMILLVGWIGGIFLWNHYQHREINVEVTSHVSGFANTDVDSQYSSTSTGNDNVINSQNSEDDSNEENKIDEFDSTIKEVTSNGLRIRIDDNGDIKLLEPFFLDGDDVIPTSKDVSDDIEIPTTMENDLEHTTIPSSIITEEEEQEDELNKDPEVLVDDDIKTIVDDPVTTPESLIGDSGKWSKSENEYYSPLTEDERRQLFADAVRYGYDSDRIVFPSKPKFDLPTIDNARPFNIEYTDVIKPFDLSDPKSGSYDNDDDDDIDMDHLLHENDYSNEYEFRGKRSVDNSSEEIVGQNSTSSASSEEKDRVNKTKRSLSNKNDDSSSSSSSSEEKPEEKKPNSSSSSSSSSSSEENKDKNENTKKSSSNEETEAKDCSRVMYYRKNDGINKINIDINNLNDKFVKLDNENPTINCDGSNTIVAINNCGDVSYVCQPS